MATKKSSSPVHIYSTLATPQIFVTYDPPPQEGMFPIERVRVAIAGGAGIASKNLITRHGVHTSITAEEYEAIKDLQHFQQFVKDGYIRVEGREWDIDKIVGDMNPRDPGGPLTPADFENAPKDGTQPVPVSSETAGSGWVTRQVGG